MTSRKGLVGKEVNQAQAAGPKPPLAKGEVKSPLGKFPASKEPPTKGSVSRNLLTLEEVCERLRVAPVQVESWLREGLLRGTPEGVQHYELEKFRARHHREVALAQAASSSQASPESRVAPQKDLVSSANFVRVLLEAFRSLFSRKESKLSPSLPSFSPESSVVEDLSVAEPAAPIEITTSFTIPNQAPSTATSPLVLHSSDTLILKSDQLLAAVKSNAELKSPELAPDQRERDLLTELQEQRRLELELRDFLEDSRRQLEASRSNERELRELLKRAERQAREEFDSTQAQARWAEERDLLGQQKAQLEQRNQLLEAQLEKLKTQHELVRQQGLQWHQRSLQQEQLLKDLRSQFQELEQGSSREVQALEGKLQSALASLAQVQERLEGVQSQVSYEPDVAQLLADNRAFQSKLEHLRLQLEQSQHQSELLGRQHQAQLQRWEQELQASASWVQRLTEAVAQRDRRLQELEVTAASGGARALGFSEEELQSQVMSLRVELSSLRRNYEIVSLQAKNLEIQLQESRTRALTPVRLELEIPES